MQTINEKVFSILKGFGLQIAIFDSFGQETIDPETATRFFCSSPNLLITIENETVTLNRSSTADDKLIDKVSTQLKHAANEYMYDYEVKQFGKELTPKDFSFETKNNRIRANEQEMHMSNTLVENFLGKLYGRMKTSYQMLGEVKITYRHRVPVNETAPQSRIRNIREITLEHAGVKHEFPVVHVDGARAMARHLSEGGMFGDLVGQQILQTSTDYKKLQEYVAYVKASPTLMESNASAFEAVQDKIGYIKESLRTFAKTKDYEAVKESFAQQRLVELRDERLEKMKNDLTIKYFDESLESVLPIINNILKEKEEYDARLIETSRSDIFLSREPVITSSITFENKNAEMSYLLAEAALCIENAEMSSYFSKLSNKLCKGKDLSEFEADIVKETIKNLRKKEIVNETSYEEYLDAKSLGYTGAPEGAAKWLADLDAQEDAERRDQKSKDKAELTRAKVSYSSGTGTAPNGQPYNLVVSSVSDSKTKSAHELFSFYDAHWGAKDIVDADIKKQGDLFITNLYVVDKWDPKNPVEKGTWKEANRFELYSKLTKTDEDTLFPKDEVLTDEQIVSEAIDSIFNPPSEIEEAREEILYVVFQGEKTSPYIFAQYSGSREDCKFEVEDMRRSHPRGSMTYAIKRADAIADEHGTVPTKIPNPDYKQPVELTDNIDADILPDYDVYMNILTQFGFRFLATNYAHNKKLGNLIFKADGTWELDPPGFGSRTLGSTPAELMRALKTNSREPAMLTDEFEPIKLYPEDEDRDCFTAKLSKDGNVWTSKYVYRMGLWREKIQGVLKGEYQKDFDNRSYLGISDIPELLDSVSSGVDEVYVVDFCDRDDLDTDEPITENEFDTRQFFVVIKDGKKYWTGALTSENRKNWVESTVEGDPGFDFGNKQYHSYITPKTIVDHLYGEYEKVWGPFDEQPDLSEYLDEGFAGAALKVGGALARKAAPYAKDLAKTAVDAAKPAVTRAASAMAADAASSVATSAFDKLSNKLSPKKD